MILVGSGSGMKLDSLRHNVFVNLENAALRSNAIFYQVELYVRLLSNFVFVPFISNHRHKDNSPIVAGTKTIRIKISL